jgi:hypothetical protein
MCVIQKKSFAVAQFKKSSPLENSFPNNSSSQDLASKNLYRRILSKAAMFGGVGLLFAVTLASTAVAQPYEILRADYGSGSQRRDVTGQFQQVVCSQSRFRMGNSTFGFDPSPGNKKSLRVSVRGARGRETMQEFPESSTIDGSQYLCRGGGGYPPNRPPQGGGQYTIERALYGTDRNNVDVTNRLRELAARNVTFRMGNSTFGVDPDPGRVKMLRIYSRDRSGRRRMFEFRESSTIDGSMFIGWGQGNWGRDPWNGRWNDNNYPR